MFWFVVLVLASLLHSSEQQAQAPPNTRAHEGQNATLVCNVTGNPTPTVHWYKDGLLLNTPANPRLTKEPGSNNLIITALIRNDEGFYNCNATNGISSVISRQVYITVNYPPKVFVSPTSQTVVESSSVSLTCYLEGKPVSTVTWFKDGNQIIPAANDSRISVSPPTSASNTSATMTITNVNRTDEGTYFCMAVNDVSVVMSSIVLLTVNYPPVIFQITLKLREGYTIRILCGADGNPVPDVTWKKDGVTLVHDGRIYITKMSGGRRVYSTLTINNVGLSDEGTYRCMANNTLNAVVSKPGTLRLALFLDMAFVNPGANFTVTKGHSAMLVCVVSGTPASITWSIDGRSYLPDSNTRRNGSNTIAELTLNNVQTDDSGVYTCTASNSRRSISTQMNLVVKVPVEVDMGITIKNKEYSAELNNKSSLQFQNLSNTLKSEISSIYKNMNGFKEVQILGFSNATGGVASRFRVVFELKVDKPSNKPPRDIKQNVTNTAIEAIKKGVFSALKFDAASFVSYEPPPYPRNLKPGEINVKQIFISWEKPENHQSYGVTGYEVQYKEFGKEWNDITVHGRDVNDYVINDLKQDKNYLVRMLAVNDRGKGPVTDNLELKTKKEGLLEHIWNIYKWLIVCVAAALVILLLTWYCLCCRRRRRPMNKRNSFSRRSYDDFVLPGHEFGNSGFDMTQLPASSFKEIPRDQITIGKELGSGQFGLVTRGYLKQDKMHCAIKMLKANATDADYMDLMNELDIMSSIEEHPNIINLIGACTQGDDLYVIVELAEYGSLLHFLHKNQVYSKQYKDKMCTISEDIKLRIGLDVARGMEHLARHRCVHRDLAARNVLLGTNMTAKLSDFGLARDVYEKGYYQQLSNKKKLPARWMSIEAIETLVATKESDIWSLGVLLWEIQTGGKTPFSGLSVKELLNSLKKGSRLNQPVGCSDQMYAVMMSCWDSNPRKRPTIEHLITALDEQLSRLPGVDETNKQLTSDA